MDKRRVVVTGLGLITPVGVGVEKSWNGLIAGRSGVRRITHFDASAFPTKIAGEVDGFVPDDYIEPKEIKKMDRFIHFGVAASTMAMQDSALKIDEHNAARVGVYVGSGMGGLPAIEHYHKILLEKGPRRITPFFIPMLIINLAAGQISIKFGAKGPNSAPATACATGSHAIGDAFKVILQAPYLLSMLERVTAPQLAIEFLQNGGQPMPVVMRPVGDTDFVHVMMPLVDVPTAA